MGECSRLLLDHASEPVAVQPLQELRRDGEARSITEDAIDPTLGAQRGLPLAGGSIQSLISDGGNIAPQ